MVLRPAGLPCGRPVRTGELKYAWVMSEKSESWALECTDCNFRTGYCAQEAELAELHRAWPHVAALRATMVLQVDIDNPGISSFMEKHASHTLRMLHESGEVRELNQSENGEIERLWKAVYFAAGVIDEYQKAIRQRPELVQEGFCQSEIFRNAITSLRLIANGLDSAAALSADGKKPDSGVLE